MPNTEEESLIHRMPSRIDADLNLQIKEFLDQTTFSLH
jgi:hypothetical protein